MHQQEQQVLLSRDFPRRRRRQTHRYRRTLPQRRTTIRILLQLSTRIGPEVRQGAVRRGSGAICERRWEDSETFGCGEEERNAGAGVGKNGEFEDAGGKGREKGGGEEGERKRKGLEAVLRNWAFARLDLEF